MVYTSICNVNYSSPHFFPGPALSPGSVSYAYSISPSTRIYLNYTLLTNLPPKCLETLWLPPCLPTVHLKCFCSKEEVTFFVLSFLRASTRSVLPEQFLYSYLKDNSGTWVCIPACYQLWTHPNLMHLSALHGPAYGRNPETLAD